ncbi:MAG: 23S rRNA (uracil(1939)-C(5))-methyltransferase RlmD [Candidatus Desulforudaceae bacterium]|nr:23S rRNA (uracil(1939)-C(5))-methyltransferase RlmD [Clostridia bacterium]
MDEITQDSIPAPGERVKLQIQGFNHAGEGVARLGGLAVFVEGALPGEIVEAEITEVRRRYGRAKTVAVLQRAVGRVEPLCGLHFGCGGCRLQHVDYPTQLELKTKLVGDSLERIGRFLEPPVRPIIGMANPRHYRNKVHYQVARIGEQVVLGFFEEDSYNMRPLGLNESGVEHCLLPDQRLFRVASAVQILLNEYQVPVYDWDKGSGYLRHVVLRLAVGTGEVMVILACGNGEWPACAAFTTALLDTAPEVRSVVENINQSPGREVLGNRNLTLAGASTITDELGGLKLRISPSSFYQVNPTQTLPLYEQVLAYSALTGRETVVDVFSGIGTIALFLARQARQVYGLEIVPEAVADAKGNASLNGIQNVEFQRGRAEELLPALAQQGLRPDVVILDPPRRGCAESVLDAVLVMNPERIVYVSCDLGTMARDLRFLAASGYHLAQVQPVDMFPFTTHVECVALVVLNQDR